MTRIVCRACLHERYVRLNARDCESCGSVSWAYAHELGAPLVVVVRDEPNDAALVLADALSDAGALGRLVEGSVRLVLALDVLDVEHRELLLDLLDAIAPPDVRRAETA